ncbi:MAG: hypothetical protein BZ135_01385 [Methanosphaera sp. rholeuAM6]|nr:MAG: hypothetical protein BZ135_01385 [Methanosphaera sp. rholeuAM6]
MQYKEEKEQTIILNNIINILEKNMQTKESFENNVNLYGIINYSRIQYFPRVSNHITGNKNYEDIFFNYTSAESMILDLFMVIESQLIQKLETTKEQRENTEKLVQFSLELLKILKKILNTKYLQLTQKIETNEYDTLNNRYTKELNDAQNKFYTLVYDEKIDFRVK